MNNEAQQKISQSKKLSDFMQICVLGQGNYGKVILVKEKGTQKIFAMKIIEKRLIKHEKQEKNIFTERNVLVQFHHPFIVQLAYTFQTINNLYFIMEYAPGGDLFNLLSKKRQFTEDQARFYTAQIILALEELHKKKIIYRDLKPENVLIDIHGYIRLADFGLSYLEFDEMSLAKSICGTPEYMAPEIIKKQGYNQQVDYWSLGGILFEMITGIPPFDYRLIYRQDQKFEKIYDRILQSDLPMPRLLSTFGKDLLNKLMQKVPNKRLGYNGIQEIKDHPWFSAVDWDLLGKKKYKAPFIPKLQDEFDVNNFEIAFTSQDVQVSDDEDDQYIEEYKHFEDFSYCLDDLQEQNINNTHQQISTIGQQQNILNQQDNDSIKLPNRCFINFDFEKIDLEEKKIDLQNQNINQNGLTNLLNCNNNGQNNQKQSLFKINEETIPKQQINQDRFKEEEGNIIENLKMQARPMQKTEIHGLQKIHGFNGQQTLIKSNDINLQTTSDNIQTSENESAYYTNQKKNSCDLNIMDYDQENNSIRDIIKSHQYLIPEYKNKINKEKLHN